MKNLVKSLTLAALFIAASSAQAVIIEEQWLAYDPLIGGGEAEYTVTNDSASSIYAFFVANDNATNVWSTNNGWNSTTIESFEWDNPDSNINYLGGVDNPIYTTSLGLFADLFTGYNQALMYTFNYYNQNGLDANPDALPIAVGDTVGGFFFTTEELASPFVAIDQNGNIVGTGNAVHVVPVPAAVWLFGSGLIGLVGVARRKA